MLRPWSRSNNVSRWRRLHATMLVVWFALSVPTVLVWADSVLFVGIASCYANAVGHFSAWQASRAEDNG